MDIEGLSEEQHGLWARVDALWQMAVARDVAAVSDTLHPRLRRMGHRATTTP